MNTSQQYIKVPLGGGKLRVNKNTGREVKRVRREKIGEYWSECDECGHAHKEVIYNYSPDKRVNPKNIEETIVPPEIRFIPVYDSV